MEFLKNIKFPYFPSRVETKKPIGMVTLEQFILSHKNPKKEILETFYKIEKAAKEGNIKLKDKLKQENLYYFTPSVQLKGGRAYANITKFNPVMVAEYDKIDYAEELKQYIFKKLPSCVCAYLSPSKKGVKFLFRIPEVKNVEEYKEYFCGLGYYLDKIEGFDVSNYNCCLPLFLSYDRELLYRETSEIWEEKGEKVNGFKPVDLDDIPDIEADDKTKQRVINMFKKAISKIEDNAHPKIVSIGTAAGGRVAAGYIEYEEMENLLHELIEENEYMQKDLKGYKRTASQMMRRGLSAPLIFDDDNE